MDLADIYKAIAGVLPGLANPAPNAPPPPAGGQTPPTAQIPPAAQTPAPQTGGFGQGVTNFLTNPLTQGALGAYFGAIGAPRRSGLGGMLSSGGITGLNAFNRAEQAQSQAPLNQAKLASTQAQTAQTQAQTKLTQGKASQIAAIGPSNQELGTAFMNAHPNDPLAAHIGSAAMKNGDKVLTWQDLQKGYDEATQSPAKLDEIKQRIATSQAQEAETKARTSAVPSEIALKEAETKRAEADTAKAGRPDAGTHTMWYDPTTKEYYSGAQRKPTDIPASKVSTATAKAPDRLLNLNRMRTLYDKEYGMSSHPIAHFSAPSIAEYSVTHGIDPISGESLPPAPPGSSYVFSPEDSKIYVVDATGKRTHQWVADE